MSHLTTHHWDEFSKSLAEEPLPRRESLRRIGAVLAGAVLSPLGLESAWAAGRDPCKAFCKCRNKSQQNACLAACRACNTDTSRLCGSCGSYACADLIHDVAHCGACFHNCWSDARANEQTACVSGACVYECVAGAVDCDGRCTFLDSDFDNCGRCGNVCAHPGRYEYGACVNGNCEYACVGGADYCYGTCTFLGSDPDNCGACGNVCGGTTPYTSCIQRTCHNCGSNTNFNWDNSNCGWCGNVCRPDAACVYGVCESY